MVFKHIILFIICFNLFTKPGFHQPWGKNSTLIPSTTTYVSPSKNRDYLHNILEACILFHQNILSPVDGPRSHFRPTSSRYMLLSLRRYGVLKGFSKGCDRLLRENKDPWVYREIVINDKIYKFDPTY